MTPSRPRGSHNRELDHVLRCTDAPSLTVGSAAPEANPHGLGRIFSPAHSCARRRSGAFAPRLRSLLPDGAGHYGGGSCVSRAAAGLSFHPGLAPIVGCAALLNFFVSRPQPGSYPTHDGADAFHAPEFAWSAAQCLVPGRSEKFGP